MSVFSSYFFFMLAFQIYHVASYLFRVHHKVILLYTPIILFYVFVMVDLSSMTEIYITVQVVELTANLHEWRDLF